MTTYTYILTQPWPIGGVLVPAGLVVVPGATSTGPSLQGPFPDLFDYIDALGLLSRVLRYLLRLWMPGPIRLSTLHGWPVASRPY
jgi:hypothetical protein